MKIKSSKILASISVLCLSFTLDGQIIKKQIGTSVCFKNKTKFADSTIAMINDFDKQNRTISEWKLFRDTSGVINDTNYVELDTLGSTTYFSGGGQRWYYKYDKYGNLREILIYKKTDTIKIHYHIVCDDKNRPITTRYSSNGEEYKPYASYEYNKNTTIIRQNGIVITTIKKNKLNKILLQKSIKDYGLNPEYISILDQLPPKSTESITYKYNRQGKILLFTKEKNGKIIKRTYHYYKNEKETHQVEKFYKPDYEIITKFKYEYW